MQMRNMPATGLRLPQSISRTLNPKQRSTLLHWARTLLRQERQRILGTNDLRNISLDSGSLEHLNTLRRFLCQDHDLSLLNANIKVLDEYFKDPNKRPRSDEKICDFFGRLKQDTNSPVCCAHSAQNRPLTGLAKIFRKESRTFAEAQDDMKLTLLDKPHNGIGLVTRLRKKGLGDHGCVMLAKLYAYIPDASGRLGAYSILAPSVRSKLQGNW